MAQASSNAAIKKTAEDVKKSIEMSPGKHRYQPWGD